MAQSAMLIRLSILLLVFNAVINSGEDDQFSHLLTSSRVHLDSASIAASFRKALGTEMKLEECAFLTLRIPRKLDPLIICLKNATDQKSVLHPDFTIRHYQSTGQIQETSLKELAENKQSTMVKGYVMALEYSSVNGHLTNGTFHGTIFFTDTHDASNSMRFCTVSPLSELKTVVDVSDYDDDELQDLQQGRTEDSIVTCDDEVTPDGMRNRILSRLKQKPLRRTMTRSKRSANDDDEDDDAPAMPNPSNTTFSQKNFTATKTTLRDALFVDKPAGRHQFLEVKIAVNSSLVSTLFQGLKSMTTLLTSYVELIDWVTRAQDFNGDGKPDNIGFVFKEIDLVEYKPEPPALSSFSSHLRKAVLAQFHKWRTENSKRTRSIEVSIVPLESPLYLHLGVGENGVQLYEGCTACGDKGVIDGIINPNVVKYSHRGEVLRLMYAIMQVLTSSIVYTRTSCKDCVATDLDLATSASGGDVWGACLVEGSLYDSSKIPLNSFRLSSCSLKEGKQCLLELNNRKMNPDGKLPCIQKEPEDSYCGNGITERGEECDCGSLTTCQLNRCKCGPRNGVMPCMKLSGPQEQLCEALIKCRGFRFIHELGQMNGSYFLDSIPALLQTRISANVAVLAERCHAFVLTVIFLIGSLMLS